MLPKKRYCTERHSDWMNDLRLRQWIQQQKRGRAPSPPFLFAPARWETESEDEAARPRRQAEMMNDRCATRNRGKAEMTVRRRDTDPNERRESASPASRQRATEQESSTRRASHPEARPRAPPTAREQTVETDAIDRRRCVPPRWDAESEARRQQKKNSDCAEQLKS